MTIRKDPPFKVQAEHSNGVLCAYCGKLHVGIVECFSQTAWESDRHREDEIAAQIADFVESIPTEARRGHVVYAIARLIRQGEWRK